MMKITTLDKIKNVKSHSLRNYIEQKSSDLMTEYNVPNLDNIGCFVILNSDEIDSFTVNEMEFVEVLALGDETFLHGARILGDSYGEDVFLPVEVVRK